uniref:Uncharacterized protein n=1 Tax=Anguilla anguilla TaxID=7936 RepID=A0A0E9TGM9_ANGAN
MLENFHFSFCTINKVSMQAMHICCKWNRGQRANK